MNRNSEQIPDSQVYQLDDGKYAHSAYLSTVLLVPSRAVSQAPSFPFIEWVFADGAYAGERVARATRIVVEIVRKAEDQIGFQVHKRRWVVERFFEWIGRNRRFSRDVERLVASAEAFLYAASANILLRRLGRC